MSTAHEPRVLAVDDEIPFLRALSINLRAAGWRVTTAQTGRAALSAVVTQRPDAVLLDLGLPDIDGVEVLTRLRRTSAVPVIVVSARHHPVGKAEALDLGADDYVTKPFAMTELLARLRTCLRRSGQSGQGPGGVLVLGELEVDFERKNVRRGGEPVALTPTEWQILELLARRPGALVSREEILREVWGPGYERETQYLRVHIAHLRRKIEDDPSHPAYLVTSSGRGYLLDSAVEPSEETPSGAAPEQS
ncbi:DNA-binding response regulator [Marmoricola endophyticus]|uniref:DNA-binding response regulator n=1 Tax=Marmoricola endophyticus TaxID=2040280 RepID=A0A917F5T3_9ACTN|nr:response regulator transcription factor [Marmoricola endophyticus]GGF46358.1 DNA-binding response regulator [Marmoricola endophyticus]